MNSRSLRSVGMNSAHENSISSSDEMRVWVRYALDLGYIDRQFRQEWRDEYQAITKMLQSLLSKS